MNRPIGVFVSFCLAAMSLLFSGCYNDTYKVHYRLSLSADVDGLVKTGSSVVELKFTDSGLFAGFDAVGNWVYGVKGEATVVDLGTRGLLVATFKMDEARPNSPYEPWALLFESFAPWFHGPVSKPAVGQKGVAEIEKLNRDKPKADVPVSMLPLLVWFPNAADPKTVERVDPVNIATNFGNSVSDLHVTIEIAADPITNNIDKKLPWIKTLNGSIGKDMHLPYDHLLNQLDDGAFKIGFRQ